nr:copia protein [Tanacetum cinerariifolium]
SCEPGQQTEHERLQSPVARLESIRILLAYAYALEYKLFQMDVKSAFMNAFINEEVYVTQPSGFIDFEKSDHVYKIKKALYGLKQEPKAWYDRLKAFLIKHEYKIGMGDNTLFTKKKSSNLIIVQIYIDDIIFVSACQDMCDEFAKIMHDEFEMSMMGELNFFIGQQIKQMKDGIFFNQSKYIKEILKKFGLEESKPMKTPMSSDTKLTKDEECESVTIIEIVVYADSDHARDYVDRKSTSGICTFVGCCLTSWFSKKQTALAISTTEAEYVSVRKAYSNLTLKNYISHPHCEALKRAAEPGKSSMSRDGSIFVYNLDVLREQFAGLVIQRGLPFNHFDDEQIMKAFQKYLQPKYIHRAIAFEDFSAPHSASALAKTLRNVSVNFNLENKIISITLDNASNNTSVIGVEFLSESLSTDLDFFDDSYATKAKEWFTDSFEGLYNIYYTKYGNLTTTESSSGGGGSSSKASHGNQVTSLLRRLKEHKNKKARSDPSLSSEYERHVHSDFVTHLQTTEFETFDVLGFWKAKETTFLVLSRMAMDILSVQAASVASESAFSTSGMVLSIRRTRLTSASLEMRMCLKDHLDAQESKQNKFTLETPVDFEEEILDAEVQANKAIPLSDEEIALNAASSESSMSGPGSEGEEVEAEVNYGYDVYHDDY